MAYVLRQKVGAVVDMYAGQSQHIDSTADHGGDLTDYFDNSAGLWTHGYLLFTDISMQGAGFEDFQVKVLLRVRLDGTNPVDAGDADLKKFIEVGRVHGGGSTLTVAVPIFGLPPASFHFYLVNESGGSIGGVGQLLHFYPCTTEVVEA